MEDVDWDFWGNVFYLKTFWNLIWFSSDIWVYILQLTFFVWHLTSSCNFLSPNLFLYSEVISHNSEVFFLWIPSLSLTILTFPSELWVYILHFSPCHGIIAMVITTYIIFQLKWGIKVKSVRWKVKLTSHFFNPVVGSSYHPLMLFCMSWPLHHFGNASCLSQHSSARMLTIPEGLWALPGVVMATAVVRLPHAKLLCSKACQ